MRQTLMSSCLEESYPKPEKGLESMLCTKEMYDNWLSYCLKFALVKEFVYINIISFFLVLIYLFS